MPDRSARLKELFLNKKDRVIHFPEWLLSSEQTKTFLAMPRAAIVEIAGRDSVAAAILAAEQESLTDLIPTYVYTGTEYGDWGTVEEAVRRLDERLPDVHVHDLLVFGSPRFWHVLNGRFMSELIARFGSFSPCIGCHLYLHAVRIPLAVMLGNISIIAGERESHDGAVKINQTAWALDRYQSLTMDSGVPLLLPLRHVAEGKKVEEILGRPWKEGNEQLGCVLSGNYRTLSGKAGVTEHQGRKYLDEFAYPVSRKLIQIYIQGDIPDHIAVATDALRPHVHGNR